MTILGYVFLTYLLLGLLFAIAFAAKGCKVLDEGAATSGVAFRLMIVPASLLLWPHLLRRWLSARGEKEARGDANVEGNQHD
ncbi:MAG: hypothetical protein ACJAXW_004174 [Candidatus Azotimanducaceae bacterium]|jgi:hypothetical protein